MTRTPRRPGLRTLTLAAHLACAGACLATGLAAPAAHAQAASVAADVPAGPLANALNRFALQAGVAIALDADKLRGKDSAGLRGAVSVDEGFSRLLAGSGWQAHRTAAGYVLVAMVAPAPQARPAAPSPAVTQAPAPAPEPAATPDATTLPIVRVSAKAARDPSELPAAYAGGQVARGGNVGFLGARDVFETPFNVTNFTAQGIADLQALRVEDVVRRDPAVRVGSTGTSYYQDFMIRGFRTTGDATVFNGLVGIYPSYSQLLTQGIERVEIFKGANSLLVPFGSGLSLGGTISLVPKRATDAPVTQVSVEYAQDSQVGVGADVGRRFGTDGEFGVRVNALRRSGNTRVDNEHDRLNTVTAALDWRGGPVRVALDIGRTSDTTQASVASVAADTGVPIPAPPRLGSNYQQPFSFSGTSSDFQVLRADFDLSSTLTAYAAYGRTEGRYRQLLPFALLHNAAGDIDEVFQNGSGREHRSGLSTGLNAKFSTGLVEHDVALSWSRNTARNYHFYAFDAAGGTQPTIASNLYQPTRGVAVRPDLNFQPDADQALGFENVNRALAVADSLTLLDKQLFVTVGLRHQQVGYLPDYVKSAVTPAAAALFKLTAAWSVYANYIEALEGGPSAPPTAANRDQVYPPTKNRQQEIGFKLDAGGTLGVTGGIYTISRPSGTLDVATNLYSLNGRQVNRGVEFNLFGEPSKGVRLQGGFTAIDAKLRHTQGGVFDGQRAPGVSRYNLALNGEWDVAALPGLTLAGGVLRTGPVKIDNSNTRQINAWTEWDLAARYAFRVDTTRLTLRASLSNAFNSNHWIADVYGSFYQTAPRTLKLSATADF